MSFDLSILLFGPDTRSSLRRLIVLWMLMGIYLRHTLMAPRGYRIAGVSGSFGDSINSFSLIITR